MDIGDDKVEKTGEKLSDYAATWEGYAEAYTFDSGSDGIRLVLDENGLGTFDVGNADPLPPPSDPDAGYPPSVSVSPEIGSPLATDGFFSGFSYTVLGAVVEDKRLHFGVNPQEIWKEWCELQTPIRDDTNSTPAEEVYACVPNWGFGSGPSGCSQQNPDTGEVVPVDCTKLSLCDLSGVCRCTANGCAIAELDSAAGYPITLDAALQDDGDELEGTLTVRERVIVRMTRH